MNLNKFSIHSKKCNFNLSKGLKSQGVGQLAHKVDRVQLRDVEPVGKECTYKIENMNIAVYSRTKVGSSLDNATAICSSTSRM